MHELALNNTFFYITAIILIFLSVLTLVLPKNIHATVSLLISLLLTGGLYFVFGAGTVGFIQIAIFAIILMFIIFSVLKSFEDEKIQFPITLKPRLWLSLFFVAVILFFMNEMCKYFGVFQYDVKLISESENVIYYPIVQMFLTVKSICHDYILAFILLLLVLFSALMGVMILLAKKKIRRNDD